MDLDGNKYIDYCMCYAAMVAGHADPTIAQAIKDQADRRILYGLPGTKATDLAEEIHRRYPVIEMLRFTQSGVEATMYAVRLARAALVVRCSAGSRIGNPGGSGLVPEGHYR